MKKIVYIAFVLLCVAVFLGCEKVELNEEFNNELSLNSDSESVLEETIGTTETPDVTTQESISIPDDINIIEVSDWASVGKSPYLDAVDVTKEEFEKEYPIDTTFYTENPVFFMQCAYDYKTNYIDKTKPAYGAMYCYISNAPRDGYYILVSKKEEHVRIYPTNFLEVEEKTSIVSGHEIKIYSYDHYNDGTDITHSAKFKLNDYHVSINVLHATADKTVGILKEFFQKNK